MYKIFAFTIILISISSVFASENIENLQVRITRVRNSFLAENATQPEDYALFRKDLLAKYDLATEVLIRVVGNIQEEVNKVKSLVEETRNSTQYSNLQKNRIITNIVKRMKLRLSDGDLYEVYSGTLRNIFLIPGLLPSTSRANREHTQGCNVYDQFGEQIGEWEYSGSSYRPEIWDNGDAIFYHCELGYIWNTRKFNEHHVRPPFCQTRPCLDLAAVDYELLLTNARDELNEKINFGSGFKLQPIELNIKKSTFINLNQLI